MTCHAVSRGIFPRSAFLWLWFAAAAFLVCHPEGQAAQPAPAQLSMSAALADAPTGAPLSLPSPASRLLSWAECAERLADHRQSIDLLEERISTLEHPETPAQTPAPDTQAATDGEPASTRYEVGSDTAQPTSWDFGLRGESARKDFRVKIGGRTQFDASAFSTAAGPGQPPNEAGLTPSLSDTVNVRRARLRIEGRMYELYDWVCEYDFANQINMTNEIYPNEKDVGPLTSLTDMWLQLREIPLLGTVRVGNQKDPYGYEHLTSSRWLNFMERSFCQDAFEGPFNGGFLPGIQLLNSAYDGRLAWQVGEFKNVANPFGFSNFSGGSQTVGRFILLPVYEDEGRQLIHMAVSGRTMGLRDGKVRFRSRGEVRNSPSGPLNSIYADSGVLTGSWQNMAGLELVGNNGPWSFQSEYFGSWLYNATTTNLGPLVTNGFQPPPGTAVGTVFYQGGYAEVLYFLTGESRTYSLLESRFDRPIPRNNFYIVRDAARRQWSLSEGSWQVGMRANYLCLNDSGVNGGTLTGTTLGLNWLLSPNARVYFNYDLTYRQFISTPYKNSTTTTANLNTGAVTSTTSVVPSPSYNGSGFIHGLGMRLAFDF